MEVRNAAGPPTSRERWAWAFFDFANSSFTTVVTTVVYPRYFVGVVVGDRFGENGGLSAWSWANAIAQILVLVTAPVIGAMADRRAAKKRYLFRSWIVCVIATFLLAFAGAGAVLWAIVLVVLATMAFSTGENLVAGFLPELAPPERLGRLSALGWTLGYFGGLLALLLSIPVAKSGHPEWTNALTAAFFGIAGLPTFLFLRERAVPAQDAGKRSLLDAAFGEVRRTFAERHRFQDLFRFLAAILVFQGGIAIVIAFSALYAEREIGMDETSIIQLFIGLQLAAAAGAAAAGVVQDRLGSRAALVASLVVWLASVAVAYLAHSPAVFFVSGLLAGIAMGSSQCASRALVGLFCPAGREAEWFGLWGLATKGASVLGLLGFGVIVGMMSLRNSILFAGALFAVGLAMLFSVDVARGCRARVES